MFLLNGLFFCFIMAGILGEDRVVDLLMILLDEDEDGLAESLDDDDDDGTEGLDESTTDFDFTEEGLEISTEEDGTGDGFGCRHGCGCAVVRV